MARFNLNQRDGDSLPSETVRELLLETLSLRETTELREFFKPPKQEALTLLTSGVLAYERVFIIYLYRTILITMISGINHQTQYFYIT